MAQQGAKVSTIQITQETNSQAQFLREYKLVVVGGGGNVSVVQVY
jgi:peptidase E